MIFVDTGYLLALLNPNDQLHDRSLRWAAVIAEPLLTTEYVVWELVNSLSNPADRPKAQAVTKEIIESKDWEFVSASGELFEAAMQLHRNRPDKAWSLTDCASFVEMERRGVRQALAHDHHFEQAGFDALLRREPPA